MYSMHCAPHELWINKFGTDTLLTNYEATSGIDVCPEILANLMRKLLLVMKMMMKLPILPCAEKLELVLSTAPKTSDNTCH